MTVCKFSVKFNNNKSRISRIVHQRQDNGSMSLFCVFTDCRGRRGGSVCPDWQTRGGGGTLPENSIETDRLPKQIRTTDGIAFWGRFQGVTGVTPISIIVSFVESYRGWGDRAFNLVTTLFRHHCRWFCVFHNTSFWSSSSCRVVLEGPRGGTRVVSYFYDARCVDSEVIPPDQLLEREQTQLPYLVFLNLFLCSSCKIM